MIPLFGRDYLASPGADGAVPASTANLFIQEGRALAEKIESQSQKFEAQAKAPAISTIYADAFTRLSQGDISAFGDLERANGLAAGNPFLMSMAKDAQRTAGQMTANFFETQQQKLRFENQQTLQDKSFENQSALQGASITAASNRQQEQIAYSESRDDKIDKRQEDNDIRSLYSQELKSYEEKAKAYSDAAMSNVQLHQAGQPIEPLPEKPTSPGTLEEFKKRMGFASKTSGDGFVNESPKLPNGKKASLIEANNGLFGVMPQEILANPDSERPSPQAQTSTPPQPVQPDSIPGLPSNAGQKGPQQGDKVEEVEVAGNTMQVWYPDIPKSEITRNIKTQAGGSLNVKTDSEEHPAKKLAEVAKVVASNGEFNNFLKEQQGKKEVDVVMEGSGKDAKWQAYVINTDGSMTPMGEVLGKDQQGNNIAGPKPKPIPEYVAKAYLEMKKLVRNDAKGFFQNTPIKEVGDKVYYQDAEMDKFFKSGMASLKEKYQKQKPPEEEVSALIAKVEQMNRTPQKVQARIEDEVRKELGEPSVNEKKQAEEEKAQKEKTIKNAEKLNELQGEYDRLTKIVKSGRFKQPIGTASPFGGKISEDQKQTMIKRLAEIKAQIKELEKK